MKTPFHTSRGCSSLVVTLLCLLLSNHASAQECWINSYRSALGDSDNQSDHEFAWVTRSSEGTAHVVSGTVSRISPAVMRINNCGEIEWQKSFGQYSSIGGKRDPFAFINAWDNGHLLAYVYRPDLPAEELSLLVVLKINADGAIEWQKIHGLQMPAAGWAAGPGAFRNPTRAARAFLVSDVPFLQVEGYLLGVNGYSHQPSWLLALDQQGALLWVKTISIRIPTGATATGPQIYSVHQAGPSSHFIVGKWWTNAGFRPWVLQIDINGAVVWHKIYDIVMTSDGIRGDVISAERTTDGGLILVGENEETGPIDRAWILKLDQNGTVQWAKNYGYSTIPHYTLPDGVNLTLYFREYKPLSVRQLADGGFIVAGYDELRSETSPPEEFRKWYSGWILRLDLQGQELWQRNLYAPPVPSTTHPLIHGWSAASVRELKQGFILSGWSSQVSDNPIQKTDADWLTLRLESNGQCSVPNCSIFNATYPLTDITITSTSLPTIMLMLQSPPAGTGPQPSEALLTITPQPISFERAVACTRCSPIDRNPPPTLRLLWGGLLVFGGIIFIIWWFRH